jgi:hypothetical protein
VKVLEMFDKDDAFTNGKAPVSKKVGLDGLTRCKSTGTMLFAVGFQKLFLEQFFDDNDPSSSLRLAPLEWAEVQGVGSIMSHVISLKGKFENATIPTASVSYFLPEVLTDNLRTGPIAMTKFDGTTVEKPLLSLTGLVAEAARDVVVELDKYRGKRQTLAPATCTSTRARARGFRRRTSSWPATKHCGWWHAWPLKTLKTTCPPSRRRRAPARPPPQCLTRALPPHHRREACSSGESFFRPHHRS